MSKQLFNEKWSYVDKSGSMMDWGAAKAKEITLPHDFIQELGRTPDAPSGTETGFFTEGAAEYTKYFMAPEDWKGKRIRLEFQGVYKEAEISLNGHIIATNPYGYSTFFVDLTDHLKYGENNGIVVFANTTGGHHTRWYSGGGIYRDVYLHIDEALHIIPWGQQVTTPQVSEELSLVEATLSIATPDGDGRLLHVYHSVINEGKEVATVKDQCYAMDALTKVSTSIILKDVSLWDHENPHLYTLISSVYDGDVKVDEKSTSFGIRQLEFSVERGFVINNKALKLKGGCIHHDQGILGSAAYYRSEERKVRLLKEAGFNAIRLAHNTHSPALMDACDRLGMYVIDETFDMWNMRKGINDYHKFFNEWWKKDTDAMVLRDFNHPCVIMWSIGNEVKEINGSTDGFNWCKKLTDYVHGLDKTRPVTQGLIAIAYLPEDFAKISTMSNFDFNLEGLMNPGGEDIWGPRSENFVKHIDIAGYNYLPHRYESDHEKYPQRILYGSETSTSNMFEYWQDTMKYPWVLGDFTWTAIDYIGEAGIGGYGVGDKPFFYTLPYPRITAGCADIDICGYNTAQSFYRQIMWGHRKKPYIGVVPPALTHEKINLSIWSFMPSEDSYTYSGLEGQDLKVLVYSADDEVELFVNGVSQGKKPAGAAHRNTAEFMIKYEPGTLLAKGYKGGQVTEEHALYTLAGQCTLAVEPEVDALKAGDRDLIYVPIKVVDERGTRHTEFSEKVEVMVQGVGELIAFGSGAYETEESFTDNVHTLHEGRGLAIIRTTGERGKISIRCKSDSYDTTVELTVE